MTRRPLDELEARWRPPPENKAPRLGTEARFQTSPEENRAYAEVGVTRKWDAS